MQDNSISDTPVQDAATESLSSPTKRGSIAAALSQLLQRSRKWFRRDVALVAALLIAGCLAILFWKQARDASALAAEQLYINRVSTAEREWEVQNRSRAMELLRDCDDPRREWEWRLVSRLCFATPHINLPAHIDPQTASVGQSHCRFDPSGKYLVTTHQDQMRIWDANSSALLFETSETVRHFDFAPDGSELAAAIGNEIRIYSLVSGQPTGRTFVYEYRVLRVAYDSSSTLLAGLDEGGNVIVFDVSDQNVISQFVAGGVSDTTRTPPWLMFQPDSEQLYFASGYQVPTLWDARQGTKIETSSPREFDRKQAGIPSGISADGARIVFNGGGSQAVHVYDSDRQQNFTIQFGFDISEVALSPDGKTVAAAVQETNLGIGNLLGDNDDLAAFFGAMDVTTVMNPPWRGTIFLHDVESGRKLQTLRGHVGLVMEGGLAFSPDGRKLISSTLVRDNYQQDYSKDEVELKVWDVASESPSIALRGHTAQVLHVVLSDDGQLIATGDSDGFIRIWKRNGQLARVIQTDQRGGTRGVRGISFADQDRQIVTADQRCVVWWNIETGEEQFRIGPKSYWQTGAEPAANNLEDKELFNDDVTGLAGHGSTGMLACITRTALHLIDADTHKFVRELRVGDFNSGVKFSPNGKQIAVTYYHDLSGEVRTFDVATGRELMHVETDRVVSFFRTGFGLLESAFSPDGRRLIAVGNNGPGLVWDTRNSNRLLELSGHSGFIWAVAYSPDGKRIATGSTDETIKIWDAASGHEMMTLRGHIGAVSDLAFSRNGLQLISVGADKTVRIWNADLQGLQKELAYDAKAKPTIDASAEADWMDAPVDVDTRRRLTWGRDTLIAMRDYEHHVHSFLVESRRSFRVAYNEDAKEKREATKRREWKNFERRRQSVRDANQVSADRGIGAPPDELDQWLEDVFETEFEQQFASASEPNQVTP